MRNGTRAYKLPSRLASPPRLSGLALLFLALWIPGHAAMAQAPTRVDDPTTSSHELYAEFLRGNFADPGSPPGLDGFAEASSGHAQLLLLGYRGRLTENLGFHVAFPFARGELLELTYYGPNPPYSETEASLGNPYLGLVFRPSSSRVEVELGLNVPMAPDPGSSPDKARSALAGGILDYVEHAEYYLLEALPISLRIRSSDLKPGSFRIGLDAGAHVWIAQGHRPESEMLFDYGFLVGYEAGFIQPALEFRGRVKASGQDYASSDFNYEGRAYLAARLGVFRPALEIRTPLAGSLTQVVDLVYGLRLDLDLP